jgi:glyoxylase-like metal-dependent hydrolase (beta-lactamase superfamily II)
VPLFPNAQVYLSRQEEQMINGKTSRFLIFGNHISRDDYQLIYDGQILNFAGATIKGILTPGHTPGTMCYLVDGKYLFTGDVVRLIDGKAVEFHQFINMDTPTGIKSIEKLSLLEGIEYVFTAHHGVSDDFEKAFESFRLCR